MEMVLFLFLKVGLWNIFLNLDSLSFLFYKSVGNVFKNIVVIGFGFEK